MNTFRFRAPRTRSGDEDRTPRWREWGVRGRRALGAENSGPGELLRLVPAARCASTPSGGLFRRADWVAAPYVVRAIEQSVKAQDGFVDLFTFLAQFGKKFGDLRRKQPAEIEGRHLSKLWIVAATGRRVRAAMETDILGSTRTTDIWLAICSVITS